MNQNYTEMVEAIDRLNSKESEAYNSLNSFEKEYDEWLVSRYEWLKDGMESVDMIGGGILTPIW